MLKHTSRYFTMVYQKGLLGQEVYVGISPKNGHQKTLR